VSSRWATAACFAAALAVYGIQSLAWPLATGRDVGTYLSYYTDLWNAHPAYPFLMLFRTPVAPLFYGSLLQAGGPVLAELGMAFAYATSVVAFAAAARVLSGAAAVITAVALLIVPGYGQLFHQVSSDPIFALTFALWSLGIVRAVERPTQLRFALAGLALAAAVLTRPGTQVLLAAGIVPLVISVPWRTRLLSAAAYVGVAGALLLGWAAYNDARYGDFTVARGAWVGTPFYRTFVMEKIVRPTNGPASRKLAAAVQSQLLTKPPYSTYHVTLSQFFGASTDNMWNDLVYLSDQHWGWGSNYAILRDAGLEAIRTHWHLYVRDVADAMWYELRSPYVRAAVVKPTTSSPRPAPATASPQLPGIHWWVSTTPDGRLPDPARVARLVRGTNALVRDLPDRSGSAGVAQALNEVSRITSRMVLWLAIGLLALLVRRPRRILAPIVLVGAALLVLAITLVGYPPALEYVVPFYPAFVLFAAAMLTLPRRRAGEVSSPADRAY
jgi:hypothetical protein